MPRGMKKKSPFEELDNDFRAFIENATDDEIRAKVAEVALNQHENLAAKAADMDLKEKQEAVKMASAQYTDATKMNKLRIAYGHFVLEARGKQ